MRITNRSSIDFDVEFAETPTWLSLTGTTLVRDRAMRIAGRLSPDAPPGRQKVVVRVRVRNLQPVAGVPLDASMTLPLDIAP